MVRIKVRVRVVRVRVRPGAVVPPTPHGLCPGLVIVGRRGSSSLPVLAALRAWVAPGFPFGGFGRALEG